MRSLRVRQGQESLLCSVPPSAWPTLASAGDGKGSESGCQVSRPLAFFSNSCENGPDPVWRLPHWEAVSGRIHNHKSQQVGRDEI